MTIFAFYDTTKLLLGISNITRRSIFESEFEIAGSYGNYSGRIPFCIKGINGYFFAPSNTSQS